MLVAVWFPVTAIRADLMEPVFGLPNWSGRGYDIRLADWSMYDDFAHVCQKHYAQIRNRHGTELGYRMRNGKTEAYVKGYWT
jgi:hypothetical protein